MVNYMKDIGLGDPR